MWGTLREVVALDQKVIRLVSNRVLGFSLMRIDNRRWHWRVAASHAFSVVEILTGGIRVL